MPETPLTPKPIKFRWVVNTLAGFGLFALIGIYCVSLSKHSIDYDQQRAADRYAVLAKMKADDAKALTTVAWVDQTKGTVQIPIDEAEAREIDTLKSKPVQMGSPIAGAAPPATPVTPTVVASPSTNAPAAAPMTNAIPAAASPPPAAKTNP